jgi:hypothetical protein
MQYVPATQLHCPVDARGGVAVGKRQADDEFSPQVFYLRKAQPYTSGLQLTANLIAGSMVLIQASADKDKDVPADIAGFAHKPGQGLGSKDAAALFAVKHRFVRNKRPRHAHNLLAPRLLHGKRKAARAHAAIRVKPDKRRLWEQCCRKRLLVEPGKAFAECEQSFGSAVQAVFFTPCCSKSA